MRAGKIVSSSTIELPDALSKSFQQAPSNNSILACQIEAVERLKNVMWYQSRGGAFVESFNCGSSTGKKKLNIRKFDCPHCGTQNLDRDINASINIRNYGLGQLDNRNTAGTVEIQACGVSSSGITTSYGVVVSYDTMKQEAQSSLAIG